MSANARSQSTPFFESNNRVSTRSCAKSTGIVWRLFSVAGYMTIAALCGYFALNNCADLVPGSARAQKALCTRANRITHVLPHVVNRGWTVLVNDLFPNGLPSTGLYALASKVTAYVLGPISFLLGLSALVGCGGCAKTATIHRYLTLALGLLIAQASTNTHHNANYVLTALLGFVFVFPFAVSRSKSPAAGGTLGLALRIVFIGFFLFLIAAVYEFAVDHVDAAHGAPSFVDSVQPFANVAAPHVEKLTSVIQQTTDSAAAVLSDRFDDAAEAAARLSDQAVPTINKGVEAAAAHLKSARKAVEDQTKKFLS